MACPLTFAANSARRASSGGSGAGEDHLGYDLLVCDLDGTLIDHSMTLEPALVRALQRAAERGLLISIATGRMPAAVDRYRDELGIRAPMILYNGALIRDPVSSRDLLSLTLPRGILGRAYEVFALWDSPWWTAWIAMGYFTAALVVDGFFRDAAFCKYLCPIGQFNFVQSLVSLVEVAVREKAVCASCRTKDCIRGRDDIPGCELHLFLPRKAGNMDCTMCLDCLHACPHDNVGLVAGLPGRDLWREG